MIIAWNSCRLILRSRPLSISTCQTRIVKNAHITSGMMIQRIVIPAPIAPMIAKAFFVSFWKTPIIPRMSATGVSKQLPTHKMFASADCNCGGREDDEFVINGKKLVL